MNLPLIMKEIYFKYVVQKISKQKEVDKKIKSKQKQKQKNKTKYDGSHVTRFRGASHI